MLGKEGSWRYWILDARYWIKKNETLLKSSIQGPVSPPKTGSSTSIEHPETSISML
jgi:hypothetical protein